MVKSGLPVRYKIGNKSYYVRRGPNYHIPLRNPCEQKNPTDCHFSPDYILVNYTIMCIYKVFFCRVIKSVTTTENDCKSEVLLVLKVNTHN